MTIEETRLKNIQLVKMLERHFFVAFLPDSQEVVDELNENARQNSFDFASLISTKNKNTKEFLSNFLPKDEEFFRNEKLQKEIIKKYEENIGRFKYGLPQVCLEEIYDSRFKEELERRADKVLESLEKNHSEDRKEFNLVEDFMEKIKSSWDFEDRDLSYYEDEIDFFSFKERPEVKGLKNILSLKKTIRTSVPKTLLFKWNNFSSVTSIKQIGKKEKNSKPEKLDNIYSAYKVYGQGEYSKILIGCKAGKKFSSIKDCIKLGTNTICKKLNSKYHSEKNTTDDLIRLSFHIADEEDLINTEAGDLDKYRFNHQKSFQITEKQIFYINNELQKFDGSYVPQCLEDEYKSGGEKKSLLEHLYENCVKIVQTSYKKWLDFDKYETGLPLEKSEFQFINKTFNYVISFRLDLSSCEKEIFDSETDKKFKSAENVQSVFEKMNLLTELESVSKNSTILEPLKNLFTKSTWQSVKQKLNIDNSQEYMEQKKSTKPVLSDYIDYDGENSDADDDSYEPQNYDKADIQYGDESNEFYEYLMNLFCQEFEDDSDFVRTFSKLAKMQLQDDKNGDSYNTLLELFNKCDRVHSYSALWTYYKTRIDVASDENEIRAAFAKQIKRIRDNFIRHFKNKLGEI